MKYPASVVGCPEPKLNVLLGSSSNSSVGSRGYFASVFRRKSAIAPLKLRPSFSRPKGLSPLIEGAIDPCRSDYLRGFLALVYARQFKTCSCLVSKPLA